MTGPSERLAHYHAIQRSFGPAHDLSNVRAHIGGPAAGASDAMHATAYTMGEHVAFRGSPSLWLAAHEAAHVVQQRAGVGLPEGVGRAGDPYERQADAVADRVAGGGSAHDLFTGVGGRLAVQRCECGGGQRCVCQEDAAGTTLGAVQRNSAPEVQDDSEGVVEIASPSGTPPSRLRTGEIGELAIAQFLDNEDVIPFPDWEKSTSGNGFDIVAFEKGQKRLWCIDNKAHSGTISEATSLSPGTFEDNLARTKEFLGRSRGVGDAEAALEAIARFERGELGAVVKVVSNAYAAGNAGFSDNLFDAGIKAFDYRLGKLFSSRAEWLADMRAAGFISGALRYVSKERIVSRRRGSGFASVGGLVFTLLAFGTALYAISQATNKVEAAVENLADFVIAGLVFRLTGPAVGTIVLSVLDMCSDDPVMNEECTRREVVIKFLKKSMPSAVKQRGWGITWDEVDPEIFQDAYDLLFNTDPIVWRPSTWTDQHQPAPASVYSPPPVAAPSPS
jgi:hypothetical protein